MIGSHLYIDCFAGAAGDMLLGALLDLGVPREVVVDAIARLQLPHIELTTRSVQRGALSGTKVEVLHRGHDAGAAHGPVRGHHHHDHVHYTQLRALITDRSQPEVARRALAIFDRVARVEARRHGVTIADVVFHELGAADSIADIVGTAAALAWLAPASVTCRAIPLGGGTVMTAHGRLPVPAPATLELLAGCAVEGGGDSELTTPTGAAVLAAALTNFTDAPVPSSAFGPMPRGIVRAVGWGAGTRELADRPNLLRLVAYDREAVPSTSHTQDEVVLLEANIDDMSAELVAPLIDALLTAGALDAWIQPIVMKKGRPAFLLSALCAQTKRAELELLLFRESTTLGVRRSRRERSVLDRQMHEVVTAFGSVAVKVAGRTKPSAPGDPSIQARFIEIYTIAPELESCRAVAAMKKVSLRAVYAAAQAAAPALVTKLVK